MNRAPLSPCPSCHRHVRADATGCPFCAATLDRADLQVTPDLGGARLSRAAIFAFAATVSACSGGQQPPPAPSAPVAQTPAPAEDAPVAAPSDEGTVVALYGAPAPAPLADTDAGVIDAGAPDAGVSDSGAATDAGRRRRGTVVRSVSVNVRYGAPPPPDGWV